MNSKLTGTIGFVIGGIIGSVGTAYMVRKKYSDMAEADISEMRKYYKELRSNYTKHNLSCEDTPKEKELVEDVSVVKNAYSALIREKAYDDDDIGKPCDIPYVITPDDFGEFDDYTKISLTVRDGIIYDEDGNPIEDQDEVIGDALSHIGEYEDDSVFVRNDAKCCDYEILVEES